MGWICNECGSEEFKDSVMENDLDYLACSGCGCVDFHKSISLPESSSKTNDQDGVIAPKDKGATMKLSERFALQTYLDEYNTDRDFYGVLEDLESYDEGVSIFEPFKSYKHCEIIDWIVGTQVEAERMIKDSGGFDGEIL